MKNDAEAREVHATVTDADDSGEPLDDDQAGLAGRPEFVDEDDDVAETDAVILVEDREDEGFPAEPMTGSATAAGSAPAQTMPAETSAAQTNEAGTSTAEPVAAETTAGQTGTTAQSAPGTAQSAPGSAAAPGAVRAGAADGTPGGSGLLAQDPEQLHQRWAAIQATFVDDPLGSVTSAADLVSEVIASVVAAAQERESGLRGDWEREGVDTEGLRNALRSYRTLLDQLVAL